MRAVLFDAYPHVYGGAQRINEMLARGLPARGWELITVVTAEGPFTERLRAGGLPVEVIEAPPALGHYGRTTTGARLVLAALHLPLYWLRILRALRRLRPAVVHAVDHRALLLAAVPARVARSKVVWHVQAIDTNRLLNRLGRLLAHEVIVPSAAIVARMPDLEAGGRRVIVVPNVVAPELRRAMPIELADVPLVMSIGRLHPDKGFDVLIDALALARERVPDARLQIIGGVQDGYESYRSELMERARRRGVAAAVDLVGTTDAPSALLEVGRVYVQASRERTETFGMAILEAMAIGLPVVATDVGGVADHVRDGATGVLVAPERADLLSAAIVRSLTDGDEADRLRRAAFTLARSHRYTEAALVDSVAGVYARVASGGRRRRQSISSR